MAMMAITTSNSISVKPPERFPSPVRLQPLSRADTAAPSDWLGGVESVRRMAIMQLSRRN
jgi:hypothetical protein